MYVETVPNRNSPPAILLREGRREGKKVHKRTLANLTHWPKDKIERLRRVLKNENTGIESLEWENGGKVTLHLNKALKRRSLHAFVSWPSGTLI